MVRHQIGDIKNKMIINPGTITPPGFIPYMFL
jgi:hypothetical protein